MDCSAVARRALFSFALSVAFTAALVARSDAAPGDEHWSAAFSYPGISGQVRAFALFEGDLIVGGSFSLADQLPVENIARWDGSTWHALEAGIDGPVRALAIYKGKLYAGGDFTRAGVAAASNIAEWNGSTWSPLGEGTNNAVWALTEYSGNLVAGGEFTVAGSGNASYVARWDGEAWHVVGSPPHQGVRALATYGGQLFAGGSIPQVTRTDGLARWDGSSWHVLPDLAGSVYALTVFDGNLFVGGWFNLSTGRHSDNLARWDGAWHDIGNAGGMIVNAFGTDGVRLACGGLDQYPYPAAATTAIWDGAFFQPVEGGPNGSISALGGYDGTLIAGGGFSMAGGAPTQGICRWDDLNWSPLGLGGLGMGVSGPVAALTVWGGSLVAGGDFTLAGNQFASRVARLTAAGWEALPAGGPTEGVNGPVLALTSTGNDLVAGGYFSQAAGMPASLVARYSQFAWSSMPGMDPLRIVYALREQDGTVYAGGAFPNAVVRWTGATWTPLTTFGLVGEVRALTTFNGELIAGGDFNFNDAGFVTFDVARWDGSNWKHLGAGIGGPSGSFVNALAVFNGELVAGGSFTDAGGVSVANLAAWNGTSWSHVAGGTNGPVRALAAYKGRLIAGGSFTQAGSVPASHIARWDGTSWTSLGSGMNAPASALAVLADSLFVGGDFTAAGGRSSNHIARWSESTTAVTLLGFTAERRETGALLKWKVSEDASLVGFHVYLEEVGKQRERVSTKVITGRGDFSFLDPNPASVRTTYWLSEVDRDGTVSWLGSVVLEAVAPDVMPRIGCSPNPFSHATTVSCAVLERSRVTVDVFDARGSLVRRLLDESRDAGDMTVEWAGNDQVGRLVPGGVYLVRVMIGGKAETTRVFHIP